MDNQYKYSWFSLFMVVVVYKVTENAESVNTEPLLLGEIQDWVLASL